MHQISVNDQAGQYTEGFFLSEVFQLEPEHPEFHCIFLCCISLNLWGCLPSKPSKGMLPLPKECHQRCCLQQQAGGVKELPPPVCSSTVPLECSWHLELCSLQRTSCSVFWATDLVLSCVSWQGQTLQKV